jgi:hypothetical protein
MWVSAYTGPQLANLNGGPVTLLTPDGSEVSGFLLTMSLGLFAAQALCVRSGSLPGFHVIPQAQYDFTGSQSLIWPDPGRVVRWPREMSSLDQTHFNLWHRRWNAPLLK